LLRCFKANSAIRSGDESDFLAVCHDESPVPE
jgi:hypothetical protein